MNESIEPFPVDTEGTPVILQCVVDGCLSLDLDLQECAPGVSWMFTCGEGHWAWITSTGQEAHP